MPIISSNGIESLLFEGYSKLGGREITFTKYVLRILPIDGWHFWVKASLLNDESAPFSRIANCSVHESVNQIQEATRSNAVVSVILVTNELIEELKEQNTAVMWLGELNGSQFSFNVKANYYEEANLHHYAGDAIYAENLDNIINNLDDLNLKDAIVSNSIPLFITLNKFFDIYPAFFNPTNKKPKYATIEVKQTIGVDVDVITNEFSDLEIMQVDKVELTIYGANKRELLEFKQYLTIESLKSGAFGIYGMPNMFNENNPQSEANILTNKKVLTFDVNYITGEIKGLAAQFLERISIDFKITELNFPEKLLIRDDVITKNILIDNNSVPTITYGRA